jgi:hypothetical protein
MVNQITNPDVRELADILTNISSNYSNEVVMKWRGSPFDWIRLQPPATKGAIGAAVITELCKKKGLTITKSPDKEADRLVEGQRAEIKFSLLWKNNCYKFQQFRKQNYNFIICIGISPFDSHLWVLPKNVLLDSNDNWKSLSSLNPQHGGKKGHDTTFLSIDPNNIQDWLKPYGGTIDQGLSKLKELLGK